MTVRKSEINEKNLATVEFSFEAEEIEAEKSKAYRKNSGKFRIPGFRPGKPTSEFISKVLNKITLFGAIYLGILATVPILISHFSNADALTGLSLGGTSIIITSFYIGVILSVSRYAEEIQLNNTEVELADSLIETDEFRSEGNMD